MTHTDWPYPDWSTLAGPWPYFDKYQTTAVEFEGAIGPVWPWPGGNTMVEPLGWECPKCGAVYAPSEKECWRCNQPKILNSTV